MGFKKLFLLKNLLKSKRKAQNSPECQQQGTNASSVSAQEAAAEDPKIMLIAAAIHENWRKTSGYSVRLKPVTKDTAWISERGAWCDIQNTSFDNLPSDWKRADYEIALLAYNTVCEEQDIEAASAMLHKRWLECKPSMEPYLNVPFDELPEKDKDDRRYFVRIALEHVA
ncbi:hypothetical protein FB645_000119 [Coemansia sp. IMI 203386]|nr:hypothetical protein FB645_000119 [Coemansia sp. IMI 203386]